VSVSGKWASGYPLSSGKLKSNKRDIYEIFRMN
jgi:hypothetical protein